MWVGPYLRSTAAATLCQEAVAAISAYGARACSKPIALCVLLGDYSPRAQGTRLAGPAGYIHMQHDQSLPQLIAVVHDSGLAWAAVQQQGILDYFLALTKLTDLYMPLGVSQTP